MLAKEKETSFLLWFINKQCKHSMPAFAKQRRFSSKEIRFWLSHRNHSSRKGIRFLSRRGNFYKKKNNNSNNNFNLHIPSNRTLDSYQSSFFYGIPSPSEVQRITETAETYIKEQSSPPLLGISFDGVFAKQGYDFNFHTRQVYGGSVVYSIADFIKLSKEQVLLNSGREILQFYLQSLDGGYVEPIAHIVIPYGKPAFFVLDFLKKLVDSYSTALIKIVASFSDGDVFTLDEESIMDAWNQSVQNLP
jgi:hypothetical protein